MGKDIGDNIINDKEPADVPAHTEIHCAERKRMQPHKSVPKLGCCRDKEEQSRY